jgi:uridine kinase
VSTPVVVIGVAGPSASGKSTICRALAARLGTDHCTVIPMDAYYRDLSALEPEARAKVDFDRPAALEMDLLLEHVRTLRQGGAVDVPVYDFASMTRAPGSSKAQAARVVIVEGLFALADPALVDELDLAVFVETPDAECLRRRIDRDTTSRGRTAAEVTERYEAYVRPAAEQCVLPTRVRADVSVNGTLPIDGLVEDVLARISPR